VIVNCPLPAGTEISADVAIIGGGPAGISLALRLAKQPGIDVALLESGGLTFDETTQELARGSTLGQPYYPLHETRIRMLGGSSQSWGGVCTSLDATAMQPRPWVSGGGWPFPGDTLDPFLADALAMCGIGPEAVRSDEAAHAVRVHDWSVQGEVMTPVLVHFSRPVRFGTAYRAALAAARNVRVYLHATAVELEAAPGGRAVDGIVLRSPGAGEARVRARAYVLAAGGIENARLLLASNRVHAAGLGNLNDQVGRCFMEHPRVATCYQVKRGATPLGGLIGGGAAGTLRFLRVQIAPEVQRREELLAWHANLQPVYAGQMGPTWLSVRRIAIALRTPWRESPYFQDGGGGRSRLQIADLAAVLRRPDRAALSVIGALADPPALRRYLQVTATTEQVPDPENRVELSADIDPLGVPRVKVHWRVSGDEERTYRRGLELLLGSLETVETGISGAALESVDPWPGEIIGTWHHLGATRMSAGPRTGVVDEDARVHGVENLFAAGGSVFPVSGSAAPTVAVIQLALRLGDHLVNRLTVPAPGVRSAS
jgi:choline dehydrogenase-like flavoprotein